MTDGAIECYKLDVACDIPEELLRLQSDNDALNRKMVLLKITTVVLSAGISIYIISKILSNERNEKERRAKRV